MAEDPGAGLAALEGRRYPLPREVLDVCEAFVAAHGVAVADISTAAAADVSYIIQLTLRLRAQTTEPAIRERCLDLIDQLVVLYAYRIESNLDDIER